MFDVAPGTPRHQRVAGRAAVSFGAGARLTDLAQAGSAKAMMPRMHGRAPEVVFLNTAGGLTGGDRLDYAVDLAGGHVVATTQTAERAYRSAAGVAEVTTRLTLAPGRTLHWLPQEVILFDGAALDRRLEVEMAGDATLILLETLVLGRAAMGETVRHCAPARPARGHARRAARADRGGSAGRRRPRARRAAGLDGARAWPRSRSCRRRRRPPAQLRAVLPADGPVRAAASAWDGG
jgi:urease accessory protein